MAKTTRAAAAKPPSEAAQPVEEVDAAPKGKWARMNLSLGVAMVTAGVLLDTVGFIREDIVAAAGAVVVLIGFVGILIVLVKGMPARANLLGFSAIVLGTLLIVHDVVFAAFGIFAHATLGILMIALGALQIVGRSKLVDLLGQTQTA